MRWAEVPSPSVSSTSPSATEYVFWVAPLPPGMVGPRTDLPCDSVSEEPIVEDLQKRTVKMGTPVGTPIERIVETTRRAFGAKGFDKSRVQQSIFQGT